VMRTENELQVYDFVFCVSSVCMREGVCMCMCMCVIVCVFVREREQHLCIIGRPTECSKTVRQPDKQKRKGSAKTPGGTA